MALTNASPRSLSVGTNANTPQQLLLSTESCPPEIVQAYHTLLTNVDLALGPDASGMMAIAGIMESADAALVAANLAILTAQNGERTLLVDCDIQHNHLTQMFKLHSAPGMAQFLGGEHSDLRTLAQSTPLPLLGVIVGGTDGGLHGRLARHGDLAEALEKLRNAADRIILLTPPVLSSTDLLRIAPYIDGLLLALTVKRTTRESMARARALLSQAGVPLIGSVLTPEW